MGAVRPLVVARVQWAVQRLAIQALYSEHLAPYQAEHPAGIVVDTTENNYG